eukprot:CAMPEP_0174976200 /NCGR_PEP_ID=MMETSP0004_2-20121128/12896_1 /TAXON_ID=420556 /ORGANISM="Ochromonas sp., Strain CCMP1393" /LENGTH=222 /DNA_ID=CAMNT_0016227195 /DNA_START=201 /DNA_END=869 /DNA_ORIENTATION=-
MLSEEEAGSPLPGFDNVIKENDSSKINSESPLVDRALDSALDFLQDAEGDGAEEEDDEFDIFEIYEDSPDLDIPYDLIAELEQKEAAAEAGKMPSAAELNNARIKEVIARWRKHENDVGSAQVQVAIANERVGLLTKHLLANKKDMSAKRGLQAVVVQRRKFLNYLYKHDNAVAQEMISEMGIRFRPPGRAWDKSAKYAAFKNTKNKYIKTATGKMRTVKAK